MKGESKGMGRKGKGETGEGKEKGGKDREWRKERKGM
jgi:hypothetical protein